FPKLSHDRIVIAQLLPARAANDTAGEQKRQPRTRDENAVAVIRRGRVSCPSQRLRQRTIRIRRLPTTHQLELVRQAVENIAFASQHPDAIARLPVADGDVEVTAQYEVSSPAEGAAMRSRMCCIVRMYPRSPAGP